MLPANEVIMTPLAGFSLNFGVAGRGIYKCEQVPSIRHARLAQGVGGGYGKMEKLRGVHFDAFWVMIVPLII